MTGVSTDEVAGTSTTLAATLSTVGDEGAPDQIALATGDGRTLIWADALTFDPDEVVAVEVRGHRVPGLAVCDASASMFVVERALEDFDTLLRRCRAVIDDLGNPVARLRLSTDQPAAAAFLRSRAADVMGHGYDVDVVVVGTAVS